MNNLSNETPDELLSTYEDLTIAIEAAENAHDFGRDYHAIRAGNLKQQRHKVKMEILCRMGVGR